MKNRQFRILLVAILLQPVIMYFWWGYRVEYIHYASNTENTKDIKEYLMNIDQNVVNLDEKLESMEYNIWIIETNVLAIDDWLYGVEKRLWMQ